MKPPVLFLPAEVINWTSSQTSEHHQCVNVEKTVLVSEFRSSVASMCCPLSVSIMKRVSTEAYRDSCGFSLGGVTSDSPDRI